MAVNPMVESVKNYQLNKSKKNLRCLGSNTKEAHPSFFLSSRTEDMTSTFGKGSPLPKSMILFTQKFVGADGFRHCFNRLQLSVARGKNMLF